jgi:23S rRNA pseudouridine2605 synthase
VIQLSILEHSSRPVLTDPAFPSESSRVAAVSDPRRQRQISNVPSFGSARALSKLGYCSRSEAWEFIQAGRVRVNGTVCRNPEKPIRLDRDRIKVDGRPISVVEEVYLMLNKPAGLVTTANDEKGRETVFRCLMGKNLPFVSPVGRLDRASEGLLLFTNDTKWSACIADPSTHLNKTYHVQVNCVGDKTLLDRIVTGVRVEGEHLAAKSARLLRAGQKNSWIEIVLDEGRNRHIRRLMEAFGLELLRLIRVAIVALPLGKLAQGEVRFLTQGEVTALKRTTGSLEF